MVLVKVQELLMTVGHGTNRFVVQKHAARHLHYDFRLEIDNVFKSWAIPKGPCLDPKVKRLAVEVEDHAIEFGDFEGIIPAGQYGTGAIIVWDRGTWIPQENPVSAYRTGHLKFQLCGQKLRGGWALVRISEREGATGPHWLLIKERDREARNIEECDVLTRQPESVISGRTVDDIRADSD